MDMIKLAGGVEVNPGRVPSDLLVKYQQARSRGAGAKSMAEKVAALEALQAVQADIARAVAPSVLRIPQRGYPGLSPAPAAATSRKTLKEVRS
jgi:hypothetical protein